MPKKLNPSLIMKKQSTTINKMKTLYLIIKDKSIFICKVMLKKV